MRIYIEIPDNTVALVATYLYPNGEYPNLCMSTLQMDSDGLQEHKEAVE